jgi:hypothetical protein
VVHLESGDEAVILEGEVVEVRSREALERFADAYQAKYEYRRDPGDEDSPVLMLRPRVAQTWTERDFPGTATRWVFE